MSEGDMVPASALNAQGAEARPAYVRAGPRYPNKQRLYFTFTTTVMVLALAAL